MHHDEPMNLPTEPTPAPTNPQQVKIPKPVAPQQQTASQRRKFVLVAEDDIFYANVYKLKLTKEGYDVEVAPNGEWAIRYAQKRKPDLILLDLVMPIKDGFETLRDLKADPNLKDVNVVILSNLGQEEDIEKAKKLGALDYWVKTDISIQELIEQVKKYL